jgi:RNA 2',3'-cyclic 3'-phosphodiesterase
MRPGGIPAPRRHSCRMARTNRVHWHVHRNRHGILAGEAMCASSGYHFRIPANPIRVISMVRSTSTSPQLSLAGLVENRPTDRLFFALFPDADAAGRIARLAQSLRGEHGLHGRPHDAARLHVTLHHLGDYAGVPQHLVDKARRAAAQLSMPEFEVAFDSVSSFSGRPGNRPFVLRGDLGVASLVAMQAALGESMKAAGLAEWTKGSFTPHVTLLYDDLGVAPQAIEPIRWTAREFVLVHSELGRTRHHAVGRWPLRG